MATFCGTRPTFHSLQLSVRNEEVENETTGEEVKQLEISLSSSPVQKKWTGFYTVSNNHKHITLIV